MERGLGCRASDFLVGFGVLQEIGQVLEGLSVRGGGGDVRRGDDVARVPVSTTTATATAAAIGPATTVHGRRSDPWRRGLRRGRVRTCATSSVDDTAPTAQERTGARHLRGCR